MLLPHSLEYTHHIFKYRIWHSNFFYNKEVWAVSLFSNYHTIKQQSAESKVYNSCSLEVDINLKNSFIAPLFVVIWSGFAKPYPCLQVHCPVRLLKSIYVRNILELCPQWYKADNFVCKLDDLVWQDPWLGTQWGWDLTKIHHEGFTPFHCSRWMSIAYLFQFKITSPQSLFTWWLVKTHLFRVKLWRYSWW